MSRESAAGHGLGVLAECGEDAPRQRSVRVLAHDSVSVATTASAITRSGRPGDLARLAQPRERLVLGEVLLRHEQALGALDRLACGEGVRQRRHLLAHGCKLRVARLRRLDRRQQVGLAERLDEVTEDARLHARETSSSCPYAVSITIGIGRSSMIRRAASIPSSRGIFTSSTARSGRSDGPGRPPRRRHAPARRPRTGVLEHLRQVEADDRLVLRDQDTRHRPS